MRGTSSHSRSVGWAWILFVGIVFAMASPAWAQSSATASSGAGSSSADLAKKLTNPVADLVSVPLQFNWAQPVGPDDATRFILNIQPVMPFGVSEDWNLITRMIFPIIGQPALYAGGEAVSGNGDLLASFFLSPKEGRPIWGIGPAISLPSTSNQTLGSGKWSIGPTGVLLVQQGPWTYGALANQLWSFAGPDHRSDVNQFYVQPFLSYVTSSAVTFVINSESLANWEADSGEQWTVPINLMVSKLSTFGVFPASYQVGVGYYVETPEDAGPDWQLRASIALLLPKKE